MEYTLKFVVDDYDPQARYKKNVKINRRNRDEIMQGYTDTRYSWSIKKYMGNLSRTAGFGRVPIKKQESWKPVTWHMN